LSEKKDYKLELTENRYEIIENILKDSYIKSERKFTWTDLLDTVFLNKWLGIPIFIVIIWAMFQFTFEVAAPFMELIDIGFQELVKIVQSPFNINVPPDWLPDALELFGMEVKIGNLDPNVGFFLWQELSASPFSIWGSFLSDGIIGALGFIMIFIPNIFLLFLFLSFLEDSGYLSRAAFVMDRALVKIGLHGKSFVPMLMGFGCNIPAIMAARTIEEDADRKITILVNPFISCSARLPVYVLIGGFFFAGAAGSVIFILYMLGISVAILVAFILRKTIFKAKPSAFIMELPPYRAPTLKSASLHMWEKGSAFVKKVFTVILLGSILIWAITYLPWKSAPYETYGAMLGHAIEPIFAPMGFLVSPLAWILIVALIFGFLAKEVVVEVLGVIMAAVAGVLGTILSIFSLDNLVLIFGNEDLGYNLNLLFGSPIIAFSYMVFTLLYIPCLASVGVLKKELNSWKWTVFSMVLTFVTAYCASLAISGVAQLVRLV